MLRDFMDNAIEQMSLDLNAKKIAIIKERLKALNITLDFEAEEKRLFKSIACVKEDGLSLNEAYYYNDGSVNGQRIVTFIEEQPSFEDFKSSEIKISFNYY